MRALAPPPLTVPGRQLRWPCCPLCCSHFPPLLCPALSPPRTPPPRAFYSNSTFTLTPPQTGLTLSIPGPHSASHPDLNSDSSQVSPACSGLSINYPHLLILADDFTAVPLTWLSPPPLSRFCSRLTSCFQQLPLLQLGYSLHSALTAPGSTAAFNLFTHVSLQN